MATPCSLFAFRGAWGDWSPHKKLKAWEDWSPTKNSLIILAIVLENGQKGFLRNFDLADLHHAFFTGLLLFEELAFTRDVATITLGKDVLSDGIDRFARNDFATNGALNGDLELLAREGFTQPFADDARAFDGAVFMNQNAQSIDGFVVDENRQFGQLCLAIFEKFIIKRRISFGYGFEFVIKIE